MGISEQVFELPIRAEPQERGSAAQLTDRRSDRNAVRRGQLGVRRRLPEFESDLGLLLGLRAGLEEGFVGSGSEESWVKRLSPYFVTLAAASPAVT